MKIHALYHVPFEQTGCIADWIDANGHQLTATRMYEQDTLPNIATLDWLIVMGGPMSVCDETLYPWLVDEKRYIESAIHQGKVVLGICLGAQLIADVLGARVYPNEHKEIGWFPIEWTEAARQSRLFDHMPSPMQVFHWHGDTFDLPKGALHLASSAVCHNQAFVYDNRVIGLQFHIEMKQDNIAAIIDNCGDELVDAPYIQSAEEMLRHADDVRLCNEQVGDVLQRVGDV